MPRSFTTERSCRFTNKEPVNYVSFRKKSVTIPALMCRTFVNRGGKRFFL